MSRAAYGLIGKRASVTKAFARGLENFKDNF